MSSYKKFLKDWIPPVVSALIIAWLINKFVFFTISVPTGSMEPTIMPGDRLIVTRIYNPDNLKRGEVIVFNLKERNEKLIKRIIGLPGDSVDVKEDGSVYVNNNKLDEPYIKNLGGKTGIFKVPKDSFFMMGDNRPNSFDSRWWKNTYISKKDILGKAQITIYPFNKIGKLK